MAKNMIICTSISKISSRKNSQFVDLCGLLRASNIQEEFGTYNGIVINSHFHPDSTGSNHVFKQSGFKIYASKATESLLKIKGDPHILPTKTFALDDSFDIPDAFEPTKVIFPGKSHAPDNVVVYFPEKKLLFGSCMIKTGDTLGYLGDADTKSWRVAMSKLSQLDVNAIVPGHTYDFRPEVIQNTIRLLDEHQDKSKSH